MWPRDPPTCQPLLRGRALSAIRAQSLAKRYRRLTSGRPRTIRNLAERSGSTEYWALRDVSFAVERGESFGIIGRNGSGKSTLLRLLAGVTRQTSGTLEIDGDAGAVLTLGGGFHPMLTAEENALTGALIGGLTQHEARATLPAISEFAELDEEMTQPLRMLSDGQRMRLAFAVAISTDPEILFLDEVLGVGDIRFQEKCHQRLNEIQAGGATIVVVSHDLSQIRKLCDRAMWLEGGMVRELGQSGQVTHEYDQLMHRTGRAVQTDDGGWRLGTKEVEIVGIQPLGNGNGERNHLFTGDPFAVRIDYKARRSLDGVIFGLSLHTRGSDRTVLNIDTTSTDLHDLSVSEGAGSITVRIERLDLAGGSYLVDAGVFSADWEETYDYLWEALPLDISGPGDTGELAPPIRWEQA